MRNTLFGAAIALLPCAVGGQDFGAIAGTSKQAAGIIGNAGGGTKATRSEELVYRDEPAAPAQAPVRKTRSARHTPASNLPPITPITRLALQPQSKPVPSLVSKQTLANVKEGQSRTDLVSALGNPTSVAKIQGLAEGNREVYTYRLSKSRSAYVRLLNGVVVGVATD